MIGKLLWVKHLIKEVKGIILSDNIISARIAKTKIKIIENLRMVERVQGALIEKIQRLNHVRADTSQYPATLKLIKELVISFNNYELQRLISL